MKKNVLKSADVDSTGLRKMLDDISEQLSVSYLKKRASCKQHKQTAVEELQDAIAYISEKEKELQVSLNIAKHLLDKNEELQEKLSKQKERETLLIHENKSLHSDIKSYQHLLEEKDIKYEKAASSLAQTEGQLMKLSVDLQTSKPQKFSESSYLDADSLESELFDLQAQYQEEIDRYKRNHQTGNYEELEKKYSKSLNDKENLDKKFNSANEQYEQLCNKHKKTVDKLKELQRVQKIITDTNEKLEKKWKEAKGVNEKLLEKLEKLEEDVKILEFSEKTKASDSNQEPNSLLYELERLKVNDSYKESSVDSDDEFFSPKNHVRSGKRQYTYTPNAKVQERYEYLSVVHYLDIFIPSKPKENRKEPCEEYFILATQAIKMNSPHMDTICVIPHSVLFEKAKEDNIPFHKWHQWIETQLNFEYIQTLYRQKPRTSSFRRFFRRSN